MRIGRLEVVGIDGERATHFAHPVGNVVFRNGLSVAEVDLDHFLVRGIIGLAPDGTHIVREMRSIPEPVPSPAPECHPVPSDTLPLPVTAKGSFSERMRKGRAEKAARRHAG